MEAKCYFIRHLKKGVFTDKVYLETPTIEVLEAVCGAEDVKNNLVRVVSGVVLSNNTEHSELMSKLDQVEEPVNQSSQEHSTAPSRDVVYKIISSAAGTVTPPPKK